jgi:HSP20 family protein
VPSTVDTQNVVAGYNNGVLTITLHKKEAAKPRQVKIAVNGGTNPVNVTSASA